MHPLTLRLPVAMLPQPDETPCGPTCLDAIYRYWDEESRLAEVTGRTRKRQYGGAILLGIVTHDAHLLVVHPRGETERGGAP